MVIKFVTMSGVNAITHDTINRPLVQHVRNMSVNETLAYLADETGYKEAQVKAAWLAWLKQVKLNANRGLTSRLDGVVYITINCKGSFESMKGPWVKGANYLELAAVEIDPWKSELDDCESENQTQGLKPVIDSVIDISTGEYNVITGTNVFSIGGNNLAPDTDATDEGAEVENDETGEVIPCVITFSDIGTVKAKLSAAGDAGEYTLKLKTRCGLGENFGVKTATRKVTVK